VAIACEPGQARKGAAVAIDSGAVIRFSVIVFPYCSCCSLALMAGLNSPRSGLFSFEAPCASGSGLFSFEAPFASGSGLFSF